MPRFFAPLCALFAGFIRAGMMRSLLATITLVAASASLAAQTPYLVRDIKTAGTDAAQSSNPSGFISDGTTVYFSAATNNEGSELWKFSGSTATMVKDLMQGPGSSAPGPLQSLGGGIYLFSANDGVHWTELWRTDGTSAGTYLVKDVNPAGDAYVSLLGTFGGKVYFSADDGVHGREVWTSDGTEVGTRLLKDLESQSLLIRYPQISGYLGSRLLVSSHSSLWLTDGTEAGTTLVKANINPEPAAINGGRAYFFAYDPAAGVELWSTDGTEGGTQRIIDLYPGSTSSIGQYGFLRPTILGSKVLFFGSSASGQNFGLWITDGTAAGTQLLATTGLPSFCNCTRLEYGPVVSAGIAYFSAGAGTQVWRTDGTPSGTFQVDPAGATLPPFVAFDGAVYYANYNRIKKTDGTVAGTGIAVDLASVGIVQDPAYTGGQLYFRASGSSGIEPWVSENGTIETTHKLAEINSDLPPSSMPGSLVAVGNDLMFMAFDDLEKDSLWRSDGTEAGTLKVQELSRGRFPGSLNVPPLELTVAGGLAYWIDNGSLWRSDGTAPGTMAVTLLGDGTPWSIPKLFPSRSLLYFGSLWRTDGTEPGTFAIQPEYPDLDDVGNLLDLAGRQYFTTRKSGHWSTAGTRETTRYLGGSVPIGNTPIVTVHGALYFSDSDGISGRELWRSDGTPEGTRLLKDIVPGYEGSWPELLRAAGRYLYFIAFNESHAKTLWRTDGTEEGTIPLLVLPATSQPPVTLPTAVGDSLYFVRNDDVRGAELWHSDGTQEGTEMVADIAPGAASSSPMSLTAVDGEVWFSATSSLGRELWRSDGTLAGTVLVADLVPGLGSSSPDLLTVAGRRLYFRANDGLVGVELWAVDLDASAFSIDDAWTTEGNAGTKNLGFTVRRVGDPTSQASVTWATADISATAGSDYTAAGGALTFLPGETSKTIDVTVAGDTDNENDESFFVVLSAPEGAALSRERATGIVTNDDQRIDLSVELQMENSTFFRTFLATNRGVSTATGVVLRVTESPARKAVVTWFDDPIAPGESRRISYQQPEPFAPAGEQDLVFDATMPAGITFTANISSYEPDSNPADNTWTGMTNRRTTLILPPYLEVSRSASGSVVSNGNTTLTTDSLITITPSPLPTGGLVPITIMAGATPGRSLIQGTVMGSSLKLVFPVVGTGQTPKLDTALSITALPVHYGQTLQFRATISGARTDGVLPTGTITFKNDSDVVLGQATLDATAGASFSRSGLAAGSWPHWIEYSGDGVFNPMRARFNLTVGKISTVVSGSVTRTSCYVAEGRMTVKAADTATAPQGQIAVTGGSAVVRFPLQPTGEAGEAAASVRVELTGRNNTIGFSYEPTVDPNYATSGYVQNIIFSDCNGFGSGLYVLAPCRLMDTRDPAGPFGGPSLPALSERTVQVADRCGIPATARAIVANVTVVNPSQNGYLRLLSSAIQPRPNTSTMSFRARKTRANNTIVSLSWGGAIDVFNGSLAAQHFIIDVSGYFQ